jgi:hypothetical protein
MVCSCGAFLPFLFSASGQIPAFIDGRSDVFEKIQIIQTANLHAFMITDFDEVNLFQFSKTGRLVYDSPTRRDGKDRVSQGEYPVIDLDPFRVYGNGAETEKGAVKEPQHDGQPDAGGQNVLGFPFFKKIKEEKQHQPQGDEHNAVLDPQRFYHK